MIKVVDIDSLKNKYLHRVGTQFDNAISVAEKEFLINAYTKADIEVILTELQMDLEKYTMTGSVTWNECIACCRRVIQRKINELKESGDSL